MHLISSVKQPSGSTIGEFLDHLVVLRIQDIACLCEWRCDHEHFVRHLHTYLWQLHHKSKFHCMYLAVVEHKLTIFLRWPSRKASAALENLFWHCLYWESDVTVRRPWSRPSNYQQNHFSSIWSHIITYHFKRYKFSVMFSLCTLDGEVTFWRIKLNSVHKWCILKTLCVTFDKSF